VSAGKIYIIASSSKSSAHTSQKRVASFHSLFPSSATAYHDLNLKMILIQRTRPIYVDLSWIDLQFAILKLALDLRFHGSHPFLVSRFRGFFPAWRFKLAKEKRTMWSGGHLLDVTEGRTSLGEELDEIIVWIPVLGPCVYPALFHLYTSAQFGDSCQGGVLRFFRPSLVRPPSSIIQFFCRILVS